MVCIIRRALRRRCCLLLRIAEFALRAIHRIAWKWCGHRTNAEDRLEPAYRPKSGVLDSLLALHRFDLRSFADGACLEEIFKECAVVNNCFAQVFRAGFAARGA
jgi:hypothetical protein